MHSRWTAIAAIALLTLSLGGWLAAREGVWGSSSNQVNPNAQPSAGRPAQTIFPFAAVQGSGPETDQIAHDVSWEEVESKAPVERLRVQVLATFFHDRGSFTQGLVWEAGSLYESTGLHGLSSLRQVDRGSGQVVQSVSLDSSLFGEGLALVGDRLIQLTWQQGVALVYDRETFQELGQFAYDGEGWGLCFDGKRLIMSNGSSSLFFRDPETFAVLGSIAVTLGGSPVEQLNELECVADYVYANVWLTDTIVRIDARSGLVDGTIDASGLLAPSERETADVLNGIAYDPDRDTFLITGKLWPTLFEVQFVQ